MPGKTRWVHPPRIAGKGGFGLALMVYRSLRTPGKRELYRESSAGVTGIPVFICAHRCSSVDKTAFI